MTPDEVLTLAKKGHPKVLAAILNRSTRPHGIAVRVAQKQDCLHILLEGEAIARPDSLVTFIGDSLRKLNVDPAYAVRVYGRQQGKRSVAWSQDIQITSDGDSDHQLPVDMAPSTSSINKIPTPSGSPLSESPLIDAQQEEHLLMDEDSAGKLTDMSDSPGSNSPDSVPLVSNEDNTSLLSSVSSSDADEHLSREYDVEDGSMTPLTDNLENESTVSNEAGFSTLSLANSMTNESTDINPSSLSISSDEVEELLPVSPATASSSVESPSPDVQEPANVGQPDGGVVEFATTTPPKSMDAFNFIQPADQLPPPTDSPSMENTVSSMADTDSDEPSLFDEPSDESFDFQSMMQRPEALVIVLFAIVLYIWQIYTSLATTAAPEGSVSGHELANRLGVSHSTISRRKLQADFSSWSASQDPDGIAWAYSDGTFVPQMPDFSVS
ncbi:MAG: hypothetical protein AAGA75_11935 [Cyanobacteria bacterium P01_E01_bin.6]